ncbi:MAG: ribonuclease Z [Candidatus Aminicenantes bacterium]|nr:ribonuclease Z [Candidatus Aminicenantes bacterium]
MNAPKIIFLGTAGSVASPDRDNTSFLVQVEKTILLIDCPGSVIQKTQKAGCRPEDIEALLVTHIHPDHIYGLPSFVHSLMAFDKCLKIFGSRESIDFCRDLLDLFRLRREKIKYRVEFFPLELYREFSVGPFHCLPLKVPHHTSSLAYRFQTTSREVRFLYSADTPVCPSLFEENPGLDYLIHDCSAPSRFFDRDPSLYDMHTHARDLGKWASRVRVKTLIPCHFFGDLNFSLSEVELEIRENYSGTLIIPEDFQEIELKVLGTGPDGG